MEKTLLKLKSVLLGSTPSKDDVIRNSIALAASGLFVGLFIDSSFMPAAWVTVAVLVPVLALYSLVHEHMVMLAADKAVDIAEMNKALHEDLEPITEVEVITDDGTDAHGRTADAGTVLFEEETTDDGRTAGTEPADNEDEPSLSPEA